MAEGLRLALAVILSIVGLTGTFLVVGALFPQTVLRAVRAADEAAVRSFWLGVVNFLFVGALGLVFSSLADGTGIRLLQIPALFLFGLLTLMLTLGLASIAFLIGGRLTPSSSPIRQRLWGSLAIIVGSLTPVVGWFGIFPYAAFLGIGAFVLSWTRRQPTSPADPANQAGNLD
ncbi:MAG: hypothetical protein WBR18_01655 [Anaerolineales bacterium]